MADWWEQKESVLNFYANSDGRLGLKLDGRISGNRLVQGFTQTDHAQDLAFGDLTDVAPNLPRSGARLYEEHADLRGGFYQMTQPQMDREIARFFYASPVVSVGKLSSMMDGNTQPLGIVMAGDQIHGQLVCVPYIDQGGAYSQLLAPKWTMPPIPAQYQLPRNF